MEKCDNCKLDGISKILFHDRLADICSDCDFVRFPLAEYEGELLNNCIYDLNGFNIRHSEQTEDSIERIQNIMEIDNCSFIELSQDKKCNVCGESLLKLKLGIKKKFELYLCPYCNSIYFTRASFDEVVSNLIKQEERRRKPFFRKLLDYIFSWRKK